MISEASGAAAIGTVPATWYSVKPLSGGSIGAGGAAGAIRSETVALKRQARQDAARDFDELLRSVDP